MSRLHRVASALIAVTLGASVAGTVGAATITVDTELDLDAADGVCSLREAILAANADSVHNDCPAGNGADRILFDLTLPAVILLGDHLPTITDDLAIRGPGAQDLTIDGDQLFRPLDLETPGHDGFLLVEDLRLAHGRSASGDPHGGGARVAPGETAVFRRVTFFRNRAENGGGALNVDSLFPVVTNVTVIDCIFTANVADGPAGGGGIFTSGIGGILRVVGSTFLGNRADHANGTGGGLRITRSTTTIEASTITANRANSGGGGVYTSVTPRGGTKLVIRDSTITENVAAADGSGSGGGGLRIVTGTGQPMLLTLESTVVASNLDDGTNDEPDVDCNADFTALEASGFSFVGIHDGCETVFPAGSPNTAGDFVGSSAAPLEPMLLPVAFYGGPTPTQPPEAPFSPLIDQGSCPNAVADQRGFGDGTTGRRPVDLPMSPNAAGGDGCDIGAVEVGADAGVDPLLFADGFESGTTLLWSNEDLE